MDQGVNIQEILYRIYYISSSYYTLNYTLHFLHLLLLISLVDNSRTHAIVSIRMARVYHIFSAVTFAPHGRSKYSEECGLYYGDMSATLSRLGSLPSSSTGSPHIVRKQGFWIGTDCTHWEEWSQTQNRGTYWIKQSINDTYSTSGEQVERKYQHPWGWYTQSMIGIANMLCPDHRPDNRNRHHLNNRTNPSDMDTT